MVTGEDPHWYPNDQQRHEKRHRHRAPGGVDDGQRALSQVGIVAGDHRKDALAADDRPHEAHDREVDRGPGGHE
jgi:hypothetical protein